MPLPTSPEPTPSLAARFGFITMAFGAQKYIDQAVTLARSLRAKMPGKPIAIVTDRNDLGGEFDIVVPMRPFEVAGTVHKVDLVDYSPFAETLFIDSDCVVARAFDAELAAIRQYDFTPVCGVYYLPGDRDAWLEDVGKALAGVGGTRFPKFNGGVYFWKSGDKARRVFAEARAIRSRSAELGIIDFDNSGPGEETLIGLALAHLGMTELYDDGGKLMRTPLNSSGPIELEVTRNRCSFIKEGVRVEPAIVHFCGPWITHPSYAIARIETELGARIPVWRRMPIQARYFAGKVLNRLSR